jgi:hypothetical protein
LLKVAGIRVRLKLSALASLAELGTSFAPYVLELTIPGNGIESLFYAKPFASCVSKRPVWF